VATLQDPFLLRGKLDGIPDAAQHFSQGSGCRVQVAGLRVQGAGCRVQGAGFKVQGLGCRVQGARFRVQNPGYSSGFGGSGIGTHAAALGSFEGHGQARPLADLHPAGMVLV